LSMEDKVLGHEVWISYKDDLDNVVTGFVILLEQNENYLKFKTNQNIITISYSRLLKMKERGENG